MTRSIYWADTYVEKQRTAEAAIAMIRPGQRVFIGSASGEPQALVRALSGADHQPTACLALRIMNNMRPSGFQ